MTRYVSGSATLSKLIPKSNAIYGSENKQGTIQYKRTARVDRMNLSIVLLLLTDTISYLHKLNCEKYFISKNHRQANKDRGEENGCSKDMVYLYLDCGNLHCMQ